MHAYTAGDELGAVSAVGAAVGASLQRCCTLPATAVLSAALLAQHNPMQWNSMQQLQVAVEQLCSAVVAAEAAVSPFDSASALLHHAVSVLLSNSLIETRTEHCRRSSSRTCDCSSSSSSSSSTYRCNDSTSVRADSAYEDVVVYVRASAKQGAAGVLQLAWGKDQVLAVLLPQCVAAAAYRAQAAQAASECRASATVQPHSSSTMNGSCGQMSSAHSAERAMCSPTVQCHYFNTPVGYHWSGVGVQIYMFTHGALLPRACRPQAVTSCATSAWHVLRHCSAASHYCPDSSAAVMQAAVAQL
eukprot:19571-Heterococcus_DN1.PRE.3